MDDQGTWPTPLPSGDGSAERDFDRHIMEEVRSDPQALRSIGGVKGNVLIVLVPVLAVVVLALTWVQWRASGSGLWLGVMAVTLMASALIWISRVKAVFNQAREVLGNHAIGSVGYGVGVIRDVRIIDGHGTDDSREHSDAAQELEDDAAQGDSDLSTVEDLSTVDVELTLSVSPVQGRRFTTKSLQRYNTLDALRLETGQHGPVQYLKRDPEATMAIETRLEPEAVERIYRAAALN